MVKCTYLQIKGSSIFQRNAKVLCNSPSKAFILRGLDSEETQSSDKLTLHHFIGWRGEMSKKVAFNQCLGCLITTSFLKDQYLQSVNNK